MITLNPAIPFPSIPAMLSISIAHSRWTSSLSSHQQAASKAIISPPLSPLSYFNNQAQSAQIIYSYPDSNFYSLASHDYLSVILLALSQLIMTLNSDLFASLSSLSSCEHGFCGLSCVISVIKEYLLAL